MRVYLAAAIENTYIDKALLKGRYVLGSYVYLRGKKDIAGTIIPTCKDFICDSGLFTMVNSGLRVDFLSYADEYADFVREQGIKNYIELDIDQITSVEYARRIRERIENRVGWQSIPVWHSCRSKEDFISDCKNYSYVALGIMLSEGLPNALIEKYTPWFIDTAHEYGAKIHGLGFTKTMLLRKYRFDSVDSSTWTFSSRSGLRYTFNETEGIMEQHPKPKNMRISSHKNIVTNSLKEWIRFQEYADKNILPIWK